MATTTRHNYDSVDAAKFVLSIFVVAIHVRPFDAYAVYFRPILRAAVPLFFLMTSYFFFNHHMWIAPILLVACFVFGLVGGVIGKAICKKHFQRAGIA